MLWIKFRFYIINELMLLMFQFNCVSPSPVILKHMFYFFKHTGYYLALIGTICINMYQYISSPMGFQNPMPDMKLKKIFLMIIMIYIYR